MIPKRKKRLNADYTSQVVPMYSARLGLPGDRENIVKLNADHEGVCKFGTSQTDQDNFELVQSNISDIYKSALKISKLRTTPVVGQEGGIRTQEDMLQKRFAKLGEHA